MVNGRDVGGKRNEEYARDKVVPIHHVFRNLFDGILQVKGVAVAVHRVVLARIKLDAVDRVAKDERVCRIRRIEMFAEAVNSQLSHTKQSQKARPGTHNRF